ncbi:hypothetical protein [Rhizobium phage RHph_X2_28B]|uniref:hypothetical protein n=1 Tax=Rhizobium phage RHph_X2_28B TaxID=2836086 RepID=UPI0023294619|nr:hypothetical protein PP751_gp014 [Rhizobium phage RHph_X2_28B]QWY83466.1 hypothetical protein [Rhizobium phage RHph_X2_28B]QWY83702.1 hypothetical protein [Rhizobium phage RHph_X3_15]
MQFIVTVVLDDDQIKKWTKEQIQDDIKFAVTGILNQYKDGPYTASPIIDYEVSITTED